MQSKFVQLKKNRNSSTTSHPAQQLAASKEQGKSRASKIDLEKIYDFDLFMKKKRHLGTIYHYIDMTYICRANISLNGFHYFRECNHGIPFLI